jgi:hypothetical protein
MVSSSPQGFRPAVFRSRRFKPFLMHSETLVGNMSLPREQRKSQPPWLDLGIFAAALAFLAYSLHAFLAPGTRAASPPEPPPSAAEEARAPGPAARSPASEAGHGPPSTEVLQVPCLGGAPRSFTSHARLLRIHGPLCGDAAKLGPAQWRASNESLGEEILVFVNRKDKSLATSYFNLKEGPNELVFVQDGGKGRSRTVRLEVVRPSDP